MKLKKYLSLQSRRDRKLIKRALKFKLKFDDVSKIRKHSKSITKKRMNAIHSQKCGFTCVKMSCWRLGNEG